MIEAIFNTSWSGPLAGLPSYGMALVSAPIVTVIGIKALLLAKAASGDKKRREWVFTDQRDADGAPILATAKVRSSRALTARRR